MAFTSVEKHRILQWLGYSVYEDDGPAMRSLNSMDSKEAVIRPLLKPILDKLQEIDDEIHGTIALSKAIKDDGIEVRAHYTLNHLRELGKQQIARLARMLKVRPCPDGDVFSSTLPGANFYSEDPAEPRHITGHGGSAEW